MSGGDESCPRCLDLALNGASHVSTPSPPTRDEDADVIMRVMVRLVLNRNNQVRDDFLLDALPRLTHLEELALLGCPHLTGKFLGVLPQYNSRLTALNISRSDAPSVVTTLKPLKLYPQVHPNEVRGVPDRMLRQHALSSGPEVGQASVRHVSFGPADKTVAHLVRVCVQKTVRSSCPVHRGFSEPCAL